jgi:uncharacterized phiE125 gp8 family phage protein
MLITYTSTPTLDNVISIAELKSYARVDASDDDALITSLRDAAINYIESHCDIRIGAVEALGYIDTFYPVRFPVGPVSAITRVDYINSSNVLTELPATSYYQEFVNGQGRINWVNSPSLYSYSYNRIKITFSVGYAEASVPEAILHAIRLLVAHFYENRMTVAIGRQANDVPMTVSSLLSQYRKL